MWPRRSHTLAPLPKITSNERKFKWNKLKQNDFNETKQIVARDNLMNNPYFNEIFKTYTNAINLQSGAVIIQKGKPIALCGRKLTDTHKRYTVS